MTESSTRRRLRSGTVVLGGVGLLAATLSACDSDPDKRCVDRDSYTTGKGYKVVDDKYCKDSSRSGNAGWYYGGSKSGSRIKSGSFTKSSGGGSGVSRGGFGGKGGSGG
ncbi:hypothetical protein ABZ930_13760 [Streptomyces sp. NPDC046716]|uniref:hypothetical protein n=1 Tax=Streptomyces sp. NPDC046716 TaxID=3157093 RepID=UPI0033E0574D